MANPGGRLAEPLGEGIYSLGTQRDEMLGVPGRHDQVVDDRDACTQHVGEACLNAVPPSRKAELAAALGLLLSRIGQKNAAQPC